jgi:predicted AAA+ superfamily ATPase
MVNGLISNRILFLLGPKHIGKKTLVYEALNEIAQSASKINHYYLNLESTAKQADEQVIKLSKFIL